MKKRLLGYLFFVLFVACIALVPAAQADVIFSDGFESGNLTAGGWQSSGDASVGGSAYNGSYAAVVEDTGYLLKVVSTIGFNNITLAYARYTYGYDYGEELTVAWSTNGSTWNTLETYKSGWATTQFSLPAGAAGIATLYIRFISDAYGTYERFRIDDVVVSGTATAPPQNLPPEWVGGNDSLLRPDAQVGVAYSNTIAGTATDPNGDAVTYSIVSGPAWLHMATNGNLSGTPGSLDGGQKHWLIEASDGNLKAGGVLTINVTGGSSGPGCLPVIEDFRDEGPFTVRSEQSGLVNMYIPQNLPANCKVPIIHLANGTGARCSGYASTLEHFASHGFIAACYESTQTGQGTQAIDAINRVKQEYSSIVDNKYGFTGHSQGGGAAIMGVYRAEQEWGTSATYAGFAIEPASGFGDSPINWATLYGQISSPVSMFNGSRDMLVSASWVRSAYDALPASLEKAWYEAVGAGHMTPIPNSQASEFGLAWFAWKLLGQSTACQYFKNMPDSSSWRLQEVDNLKPCN